MSDLSLVSVIISSVRLCFITKAFHVTGFAQVLIADKHILSGLDALVDFSTNLDRLTFAKFHYLFFQMYLI